MQINDLITGALQREGFGSQLNDALVVWLQNQISVFNISDLNTLWDLFWSAQGVPEGQFNDRYMLWLQTLGYNQENLNDAKIAYWLDRFEGNNL